MVRYILVILLAACGANHSRTTLPVETRNDITVRYIRGEPLDQIAQDFHLDSRDDARRAVRDAMFDLQRRYYRDR